MKVCFRSGIAEKIYYLNKKRNLMARIRINDLPNENSEEITGTYIDQRYRKDNFGRHFMFLLGNRICREKPLNTYLKDSDWFNLK